MDVYFFGGAGYIPSLLPLQRMYSLTMTTITKSIRPIIRASSVAKVIGMPNWPLIDVYHNLGWL